MPYQSVGRASAYSIKIRWYAQTAAARGRRSKNGRRRRRRKRKWRWIVGARVAERGWEGVRFGVEGYRGGGWLEIENVMVKGFGFWSILWVLCRECDALGEGTSFLDAQCCPTIRATGRLRRSCMAKPYLVRLGWADLGYRRCCSVGCKGNTSRVGRGLRYEKEYACLRYNTNSMGSDAKKTSFGHHLVRCTVRRSYGISDTAIPRQELFQP